MTSVYRLGDGCSVAHGYAFAGMTESDDERLPIVVNIGNFQYTGGFRFESTKVQRFTGEYPERFRLAAGDVVVVMTCQTPGGEILGIPACIPSDGRAYLHNQRLGKIVVTRPDELDLGYLYYLFLSPALNAHLVATATGSKILHTAPSRIECFSWLRPPLPVQRRIATVLGAFDDLMRNNTRRIKLLEEMARSVYREWFVEFRFQDMRGGVLPSRWKHGKLGDVLALQRGFDLPGRDRREGRVPVVSSAGISGRHDVARVAPPGVVTGRYGTLGDVYLINEPFWPLNTTLFVKDFKGSDPYWAYFLLADQNFGGQNAAGAVPGVNRNALHLLPIVIPALDAQQAFGARIRPMLQQIELIRTRSAVLQRARDLLLPRLISGEIEPSALSLRALHANNAESLVDHLEQTSS